ncbi:MAG: hypothetical protein WCD38_14185 [Candidatus Tumulicola sp.]
MMTANQVPARPWEGDRVSPNLDPYGRGIVVLNGGNMQSRLGAAAATFTIMALAGCSGTTQSNLTPGNGSLTPSARIAISLRSGDTNAAGVLPQTRGALLYVSEPYANAVAMYTYPQLQPAGQLSGIPDPEGLCVNRRTGDVWVVSGFPTAQFTEFRHGGMRPIHKIKFGSMDYTQSCAVDPTTGDFAVTDNLAHGLRGAIIVFGAKDKTYRDPSLVNYAFVSYDDSGDLFVDGLSFRTPTGIAELRPGKRHFRNFPLEGTRMYHPGGLRYLKGSLVIGATGHHVIYQTSNGMVNGSTTLLGACNVEQFDIDEDVVIVPSACRSDGAVLIYNYPAGGTPIAKITHVNAPFAAVISR